jgi:uncharacterized repeat protein (TIGR03803 family)
MKAHFISSLAAVAVQAAVLVAVPTKAIAQNVFTTLHDFAGAPTDGHYPSDLTSSEGKLYGTTALGGSSDSGILFSMNIDGTGFTNLHSFVASEGIHPRAGVIVSGNSLYGAAVTGGNANSGTVFTMNADGTGLTVLHHFAAFAPDPGNFDSSTNSEGIGPSTLILSGNTLYGTALEGGRWGQGAVFRLNTNGDGFTNLHTFSARNVDSPLTSSDGGSPNSLMLSGNTLYGTAPAAGSAGNGTLFSVNTDGTGFMNLHNFSSTAGSTNSDGSRPSSKLSISGRTLFGTAQEGGAFGMGTVFSVQTDGTDFKVLHHFSRPAGWPHSGVNSDGRSPTCLVLSGNTLYGATANGGSMNWGTIFAVNANGGSFQTLHNFPTPDANSHAMYIGDLIVSGNSLYGAGGVIRLEGGVSPGMVFRLTLPEPPQLAIVHSPGNAILSWPTNAIGFNLQSTTNLLPQAIWSLGSTAPIVIDGQHTVTDPVSGPRKFYRLIQEGP